MQNLINLQLALKILLQVIHTKLLLINLVNSFKNKKVILLVFNSIQIHSFVINNIGL